MYALNIVYTSGEVNRLLCTEHDANRAAAELSSRADVVRAWLEQA